MRHLFLVLSMTASPTVLAVPITVDITGVITQYVGIEDLEPTVHTASLTDTQFTASVTFDRDLAPAPKVHNYSQGIQLAHVSSGLPHVEFVSASVTWQNGTFIPEDTLDPATADTALGDAMTLFNSSGPLADEFTVVDRITYFVSEQLQFQQFVRFDFVDEFLEGADVALGDELPDFATASGRFEAASIHIRRVGDTFEGGGFRLSGEITSATARIARQIPEPATGILLLAGIGGLAITRRRTNRKFARQEPLGYTATWKLPPFRTAP